MTNPNSPLQIPDYRRYWIARLFAVFATISMVVLIGYQTYDLARSDYGMDLAQASVVLGLLGLAQFVPIFLLTPVAGAAADRFDRRHVVLFANAIDAVIALILALLSYISALTLPIIFVLAAAHGAARVFNGPALNAIAPNVVPQALLPKAIAMGSIAWQVGTVAGPAIGGLLYAQNAAAPYFLSVAMLAVSATLVSRIRPIRVQQRDPETKPLQQVTEGFHFVWKERFLLGCISLDLFAVLLGGATAMLPVFARDILHVGPEGLGIMRGAPAVGAALVAAWLSFKPLENNVGVKMLWAVIAFGAATTVFALSRNYLLSLSMLFLLGAADMVSVFIRNSLIQLNTPDRMRGRVSAISGLAISASNELGELRAGLFAGLMGVTAAVAIGGVGAIVVTALWAWIFPELRKARTFAPTFLHDDLKDDQAKEKI